MATDGTWIGDPDYYEDFADGRNWLDGIVASGSGATITLDPADNSYIPTMHQPTEGTFNFVVQSGVEVRLDDWLDGAQIGNILVNHDLTYVNCFGEVTGTTTVTAGSFYVYNYLNGAVSIGSTGILGTSGSVTVSGAVTNNGFFYVASGTTTCNGLFTNNGTVDSSSSSTIDFNGGVTGGGTWGSEPGSVLTLVTGGAFNLTSATWNLGEGSTLTVDDPATVNLGTTEAIANLTLYVKPDANETVTLGASHSVQGFVFQAASTGILDGNGKTFTVGADGFDVESGTFAASKTLTVDLSGSTGAYTQNGGTIASGATLNVKVNNTGWYSAALTNNGTLNIEIPSGKIVTSPWTLSIAATCPNLTVTGTYNPSGTTSIRKVAGSGAIGGTGQIRTRYILDDNFWTFNGSFTDTGGVWIQHSAARSNDALINLGSQPLIVDGTSQGAAYALTLRGGLTCGDLIVRADTGGRTSNLILTGPLTVTGNVTLGAANYSDRYGTLTLPAGYTHSVTGTLARGGTGTANSLTLGGHINVGGDWTLAGIVTDFGTAALFATANNKTIDGTWATSIAAGGCDIFANGNTLTVDDIGTANVRCWGGCTLTGTTNVQSLPGPPDEY